MASVNSLPIRTLFSRSTSFKWENIRPTDTCVQGKLLMIVVVDYPTPSKGWGLGGWPWRPRNQATLRVWTRGGRETVAKAWAAQRVRCWTVQNELRGVLGRVSTGAAGRILDSANPREKNLTEGCVRCSVGETEHRGPKFPYENWGNLCVNEFRWGSTPPVREKRRVDSKDNRRETTRDCGRRKQHSPPEQLINRVVPREKRVSRDPL